MRLFRYALTGAWLAGLVPAVSMQANNLPPYHVGETERMLHPAAARN